MEYVDLELLVILVISLYRASVSFDFGDWGVFVDKVVNGVVVGGTSADELTTGVWFGNVGVVFALLGELLGVVSTEFSLVLSIEFSVDVFNILLVELADQEDIRIAKAIIIGVAINE
jgi:hypothetical protein